MSILEINGVKREYPEGTTYMQVAEEFQKDYEYDILLGQMDGNHLVELGKKVDDDGVLTFITAETDAGIQTYRRSTLLLMLAALTKLEGEDVLDRFFAGFSISKGLYCTIKGMTPVTEEFIDKLRAKMYELVSEALPIRKEIMKTRKAIKYFREQGLEGKAELLEYRRTSTVNMYSLGDFRDYFYGYMVPDTSYLRYFELFPFDDGFVLQTPVKETPDVVPPFEPQKKLFAVLKESDAWEKMLGLETVGKLNDQITAGNGQQMILVQEALQEKKIAQIAQMINDRPTVKLVMIAGPSSSGKTTFSHRLSVQLTACGMKPHPIAVDNYFKNRDDTPLDEFGNKDYEGLGAVDVEGFNADMQKLLKGETVEIPEYNFKLGKREYKGNFITLGKDDILVIEGIHCLNDKLSYSLPKENKFKIYISALTTLNIDEHNRIPTTDGRLIRRMVRDARTRGTSAKDTIAMWYSVRRGEEKNIFPYQEQADVMFNSAQSYELAALKQYAEPALFGIGKNEPEYQEAKRLLKFLDYFVGIPSEDIPVNSLIREFVGGGCFKI